MASLSGGLNRNCAPHLVLSGSKRDRATQSEKRWGFQVITAYKFDWLNARSLSLTFSFQVNYRCRTPAIGLDHWKRNANTYSRFAEISRLMPFKWTGFFDAQPWVNRTRTSRREARIKRILIQACSLKSSLRVPIIFREGSSTQDPLKRVFTFFIADNFQNSSTKHTQRES